MEAKEWYSRLFQKDFLGDTVPGWRTHNFQCVLRAVQSLHAANREHRNGNSPEEEFQVWQGAEPCPTLRFLFILCSCPHEKFLGARDLSPRPRRASFSKRKLQAQVSPNH